MQLQAFHNQRPQAIAATGFPQPCGRGHRPLQPQAFHNHAAAGHFHWSAATATGHGSQLATGPTVTSGTLARGAAAKCVEKDDEEEEKRQAELRRAQGQLGKCLEYENYTGSAAVKENIAALMRQAELRRARDRLKKRVEEEDYTGGATVKESIAAIDGGGTRSSCSGTCGASHLR